MDDTSVQERTPMKLEPLPIVSKFASAHSFSAPKHVAILGNFPPRRCGLATYTHDSYLSLRDLENPPRIDVYAMDDGQVSGYGSDIAMLIPEEDCSAYARAADAINASGADILWIQHEFGIFGGHAGGHLLTLTNRLTIPFAVTLHTILEEPSEAQRRVTNQLMSHAVVTIVMAEKGIEILKRQYVTGVDRLVMIPHGIPDRPFVSTEAPKARLGLESRPTLLTFGLLSPDKGISDMIEALPLIQKQSPDVHYVILGATHPHLKRREGEQYREALRARITELGIESAVTFVDRFVELDELTEWLAAADIYVTPYLDPTQITSGTLSYAVGMGKPVVSTPYVHATEILADGHGRLVPFRSPQALAEAISVLLADDGDRLALARRAYNRGRSMTWQRNAEAAMRAMAFGLRSRSIPRLQTAPATIQPVVRLSPVERLTDGTGMLQHSIYGVADRDHGYCIDDNARALMLMSIADDLPLERRLELSSVYASFVQHAWNEDAGFYRNFMAFDRKWLEARGSEDSNGRTLWTLGVTANNAPSEPLRRWASKLFDDTIIPLAGLSSPRTRAFMMLGAAEMLSAHPGHHEARAVLADGAEELLALLATSRRPDWAWFQIFLSYDNTRLPEALIRAGKALGRPDYVETGLETLEWVTGQTTDMSGKFQPVGTNSFGLAFMPPAMFDQQPLEAWAMIEACAAAFEVSGDEQWLDRAKAAYEWFLGANVLGQPLVDATTSECHDGLTPVGVNLNHGAESVLAWQLAHRQFRKMPKAVSPALRTTEPAQAA